MTVASSRHGEAQMSSAGGAGSWRQADLGYTTSRRGCEEKKKKEWWADVLWKQVTAMFRTMRKPREHLAERKSCVPQAQGREF